MPILPHPPQTAAELRAWVQHCLPDTAELPIGQQARAFAPSNIALCKYWGKRDKHLHLPYTDSLSISLGEYGAEVELQRIAETHDRISSNGTPLSTTHPAFCRWQAYLNLFRQTPEHHFAITIRTDIPIAAGLASSACMTAALVLALNELYAWQLEPERLSCLARLGSGSACRSLWPGFVVWQAGQNPLGWDSHGVPITLTPAAQAYWASLRIGWLLLDDSPKPHDSRSAMAHSVATSPYYTAWCTQNHQDLATLKQAITDQDFTTLARTAEHNALAMHATINSARPAIFYQSPATLATMNAIWQARQNGLAIYFTQDAGPNLKLIFQAHDETAVLATFPGLTFANPFL